MVKRVVIFVAVNENGRRIGDSHHNSKISNKTVDEIRDAHEDLGLSYDKLAKLFNLNKSHIQKICEYSCRAQTVANFRKVVKIVQD